MNPYKITNNAWDNIDIGFTIIFHKYTSDYAYWGILFIDEPNCLYISYPGWFVGPGRGSPLDPAAAAGGPRGEDGRLLGGRVLAPVHSGGQGLSGLAYIRLYSQ